MDFFFEYWWVFLLPLAIYSLRRTQQERRERTSQMELAAARAGLVYQKADPDLTESTFRAFSLFKNGATFGLLQNRSGGTSNVAKGEVGGRNVVLLDFTYSRGFGEGPTSHSQTVGAVCVAWLKLPPFLLEAKPTERNGIKFDTPPQFSKNYQLTGADETAIQRLFSSEVLEFFVHAPGKSVECDGEWMIIYRSDHRVDPDELEGFLAEMMRILGVFRSSS